MIKRILLILLAVLVIAGLYFGYQEYKWRQQPQYAAGKFIGALQAGPDESYKWLTEELRADRESYWKKYLAQFTGKSARPGPAGGSPLQDHFNAFEDKEKPYRISYFFDLDGKKYLLSMVLVWRDGGWKVDELFGSYPYQ